MALIASLLYLITNFYSSIFLMWSQHSRGKFHQLPTVRAGAFACVQIS